MEWSRLTCTLAEKDGGERELLREVEGQARSGRLLAICGPSGSGASPLLSPPPSFFALPTMRCSPS